MMTMTEAKKVLRGESIGRVPSQEEINVFLSSLTDTEFTGILAYAEACCDLRFGTDN